MNVLLTPPLDAAKYENAFVLPSLAVNADAVTLPLPSILRVELVTVREPDILTTDELSTDNAVFLFDVEVPLPTANTILPLFAYILVISLYLPKNAPPPAVVDVPDADTIRFCPIIAVESKWPFVEPLKSELIAFVEPTIILWLNVLLFEVLLPLTNRVWPVPVNKFPWTLTLSTAVETDDE